MRAAAVLWAVLGASSFAPEPLTVTPVVGSSRTTTFIAFVRVDPPFCVGTMLVEQGDDVRMNTFDPSYRDRRPILVVSCRSAESDQRSFEWRHLFPGRHLAWVGNGRRVFYREFVVMP